MNEFHRAGGIASLVLATTFVIGFSIYFAFLNDPGFTSSDPVEVAEFLAGNQSILHVWHLIVYVFFGIGLVVLSLALYDRLKSVSTAITQTATAFGMIWATLVIASGMIAVIGVGAVVDLYEIDPVQAGSVWVAIEAVQFGIGGGIEVVGAVWILLIGWASLRSGAFTRGLNYLGVIIGLAGTLTLIPAFEMFGAIFGLGLIIWFIWMGIALLRVSAPVPSVLDNPVPGTYHHIST